MGVGIFIAGGNGNEIRGNRIWDNWRRGTMLVNVPRLLLRESRAANSVSHRNRYHNNVMGIAPNGPKLPNGVDFWWDEAPVQEDNCWFDNGTVTTDPQGPLMPSSCDNTSAGVTYGAKFSGELAPCAGASAGEFDANTCPWFRTAREALVVRRRRDGAAGPALAVRGRARVDLLAGDCRLVGSTLSCNGLLDRP